MVLNNFIICKNNINKKSQCYKIDNKKYLLLIINQGMFKQEIQLQKKKQLLKKIQLFQMKKKKKMKKIQRLFPNQNQVQQKEV